MRSTITLLFQLFRYVETVLCPLCRSVIEGTTRKKHKIIIGKSVCSMSTCVRTVVVHLFRVVLFFFLYFSSISISTFLFLALFAHQIQCGQRIHSFIITFSIRYFLSFHRSLLFDFLLHSFFAVVFVVIDCIFSNDEEKSIIIFQPSRFAWSVQLIIEFDGRNDLSLSMKF